MNKIIQIVPLMKQIDGVYLQESGELERFGFQYLALIELDDGMRTVELGDFSSDGTSAEYSTEVSNFIGLEFDGKKQDWSNDTRVKLKNKKE